MKHTESRLHILVYTDLYCCKKRTQMSVFCQKFAASVKCIPYIWTVKYVNHTFLCTVFLLMHCSKPAGSCSEPSNPDCCTESNTVWNQNTRAPQEWFRCIITQLMRHCSPQEGVFTHRVTLDSTRGCATPIMDSPLRERSHRWQLTSYFSWMHSACPLFKN